MLIEKLLKNDEVVLVEKKSISDYTLNIPHFDWISFTVFDIDLETLVLRLGFSVADLQPLARSMNFYDKCYIIKNTDIVFCTKDNGSTSTNIQMGINVQVPASMLGLFFESLGADEDTDLYETLKRLYDFVKEYNGHFSRVDVCIDVSLNYRGASFTPYQIFNNRDKKISKFKAGSIRFVGAPESGSTVYFGSRANSSTLLRIYDKAKEQGDFDNLVTRVEFEMKKLQADRFLEMYFESGLSVAFRDLVREKISFRDYEIWHRFEILLDEIAQFRNFTQRLALYPRKQLDVVRSTTHMFYQYNKILNYLCHLYGKDALVDYIIECVDVDEDVFLKIPFDEFLEDYVKTT